MPEHEPPETDPYWTADLPLGEATFYQRRYPLRLALHQSEERHFHHQELFPLKDPRGSRLYFHAKPYILLPDVTVRVRLFEQPREGVIGGAEAVSIDGAHREFVGNAQAWFYPGRDKALMLWECFLEERHRLTNPIEDENFEILWNAFEQAVIYRSKGIKRLYTTWEDLYARPVWKRFLEQHGYEKTGTALFAKPIISARAY